MYTGMDAKFSLDGTYRYSLSRKWLSSGPRADQKIAFCMLNPSTADQYANDPTIERCVRRAVALGFGAIEVVNLFAFRATDPKRMREADDPIGPENDAHIRRAAYRALMFVCAWGSHGAHMGRGAAVMAMLREQGVSPRAFKINGDGTPSHPLYLPYALEPFPMEEKS